MRRMLDPTKVGGIPSTIEFDKNGNRKVNKNLGVDGKLTLKSLVSSTNPDGDITKELGGGSASKLFVHFITFTGDGTNSIYIQYLSTKSEKYTKVDFFTAIDGTKILATGDMLHKYNIRYVESYSGNVTAKYLYNNTSDPGIRSVTINNYKFTDEVYPVQ